MRATCFKGKSLASLPLLLIFLLFINKQIAFAQDNPTFTSTPPTAITYGDSYNYLIQVNDLNGDLTEVSIIAGTLPSGLNFTNNLDGTYTIAGDPTSAGTTSITLEVREVLIPSNSNTQNVDIIVDKADLNISADPKTITYGDAIPALTFTYSAGDFVNGDTQAAIDTPPTISTAATGSSNAGTYAIQLSGGSDNNYNLLLTNALLTINKASQTISSFADITAPKTYGAADITLSATASSGLAVSFSVVSGPAAVVGNTLSITGAGTVVVAANQAGNINYSAAAQVTQSFTVAKADLNITADPKTITYGNAIPALTFTYSAGDFVNGDTQAAIDTPPTISTAATGSSNAGTYAIQLSGGSDNNYNLLLTNAVLTISQATQTITFGAIAPKTYGDADLSLSATASSGLAVSFSVVSGPATIAGNTLSITAAGTVVVAANQAGNINYSAAAQVTQSFTVAKANLNITADAKTITYGDAIPALTFTYSAGDFVNGDTQAAIDTPPTISTAATGSSNAGTYAIQLSGGSDNNYNLLLTNALLTINKASQTISSFADITAPKTYGAADITLSATASSGLAVSFSVVSGPAAVVGNTLSITAAGTVVVAANQAGNINYSAAAQVTQSFTVAKADLNITADPKTITYGNAIPALTFTYSAGDFVNGDTQAAIDTPPTISTAATGSSNAGTYAIQLSGGSDNNYNLLLTNAVLTISQATQTITFGAIAPKTYGDADLSLSATASSGLAVSFSVVSGPATIAGNTLSITAAGTVVVAANQAGNINYSAAAQVTQSFTVAKANLNITADAKTITYGNAIPALTFTYSAGDFVNGDTQAAIDTPPTISTAATGSSNAGTYAIQLSGGSDNNYNLLLTNAVLTISQATQTITFGAIAPKTYGAADITLSATASSGLAVSFSVVSGPATIVGNTLSITAAGTVVVAANQAGNTNYAAAAQVTQSFTVAKANLNITADAKTITYGNAIPALTFTYSAGDFVNGDTQAAIDTPPTISTAATGSSNAGTYAIQLSGGSDNNYNLLLTNAVLTISQATQTITFGAIAPKTYGDADLSLSATASSGLAVSFSVVSGPATIVGNTLSITAAGTVVVAANQAGNTNYTAATQVTQSFTVAKANLNITADAKTITYGNAIPTLTFTYSAGDFVNGDTQAAIDTPPTISTAATESSNAGTYAIQLSGGSDNNYNLLLTNAVLTISQATQTITFGAIAPKTYGDADLSLSATASSGLAVSFSVVSGPATIVGNTLSITAAGTVVVAANQAGNTNYSAAAQVTQSFTVAKADLNITADPKTITYGNAIPALTFTYSAGDFVNGDTQAAIDTPPTISTTATGSSNAGTYAIQLSGGSDNNYNLLLTNAVLTINKAIQSITFGAIPAKTFGDANFNLTATASSGLAVSFSVVSGPAAVVGNTLSITAAGTVVVAANQAGNTNYTAATQVTQSFTVAKANLNITADAKTISYGNAIPTLTFTYSAGDFVNGDTQAAIDTPPTISTAATGSSNAGTYAIQLSGGSDNNYNLLLTNAVLTISQATQTITFGAIAPKTYGAADITLSATASSGLAVSFSVVSGPATIVGNTLSITAAGTVVVAANQAGNTNYSAAAQVTQSFTVAKADLNITADPKTITYGNAIPALTFTYSAGDFVNGDTQAAIDTPPTISTTATGSSNAGTYAIQLSGGSDNNYNLLLTNAVLTINKASQSITFSAIPAKTFGDADFNLTATASSGLAVSFSVVSGPVTVSGNTVSITGAGTAVIAANQAGNVNYNPATQATRILSIAKANATINLFNTLRNFTGSPQSINFNTNPANLTVKVLYNGSETLPVNQGSYSVTAEIIDVNYVGTSSTTFTINGAPDVTSISDFNLNEDQSSIPSINLLNYFSDVEDADSELVFSIISNSNTSLFNQFSLNGAAINLSLIPNAFGTNNTVIRCIDSNGLSTEANLFFNVAAVPDIPIFGSTPIVSINEDQIYNYTITATDGDPNDQLSISTILALPTWLSLNDLGNGTAILNGTANNNQVGNYGIALQVSDEAGNIDQQFFNIEVVNTNDRPVITSTPVATAALNTAYSYTFTATDVDVDDVLTITTVKKPSWLSTNQPEPGKMVLSGTPTETDRNESTEVLIEVADLANARVSQNFYINVNFPNTAPSFTSTPLTSVLEDDIYNYAISIEDIEEDDYTINALTLPSWLALINEAGEYRITGTPTNDQVGSFQVIIEVVDQLGARSSQNFNVTVINVNDAPSFNVTPITTAKQNNNYQLPLTVVDVDQNDSYLISFLNQPSWLRIENNTLLTGTPSREDVEQSPFEVSIMVADEANATDTLTFEISVTYENNAPTMAPLPSNLTFVEDNEDLQTITLEHLTTGGEANQTLTVDVESSNNDLFESLVLSYQFPDSTGNIQFKLAANQFGTANLTITVMDNGADDINSISQIIEIVVTPVNDIPFFTSTPVIKAQAGSSYQYQVSVQDDDPSDVLSFALIEGPSWLTLTKNGDRTAILNGEVPPTATSESINISVTDQNGGQNSQAFEIQINNQPEIIAAVYEINEDTPFVLDYNLLNTLFSDADGDTPERIVLNWDAGVLSMDGTTLDKNVEIPIDENTSIIYTAPENFVGAQTLTYRLSDQFIFSETAALKLNFLAVNDSPILTNLETNQLAYVQGTPAIAITETISISDVDNQTMDTATVKITGNYNIEEDRLSLSENLAELTASFNTEKGELIIIGNQSKSNYELALTAVRYRNINSLSTDTDIKTISFQVSDGQQKSNVLSREVILSEVLPELNIVNAFTPNQDGVNDTWGFNNLEQFEEVKIRIITAEGQLVFECFSNTCRWDGIYNGDLLPAGPYFYKIELNNGRRIYEGIVTILR